MRDNFSMVNKRSEEKEGIYTIEDVKINMLLLIFSELKHSSYNLIRKHISFNMIDTNCGLEKKYGIIKLFNIFENILIRQL